MLLFWRGAGIWVLPIMFCWLFLLIGLMIATAGPVGNPDADAYTSRLFALSFALSAVTVFFIAHRREHRPPVIDPATGEAEPPVRDDFMYIPMKYWAYLFGVGAAYLFVRSFFQ